MTAWGSVPQHSFRRMPAHTRVQACRMNACPPAGIHIEETWGRKERDRRVSHDRTLCLPR